MTIKWNVKMEVFGLVNKKSAIVFYFLVHLGGQTVCCWLQMSLNGT